MTGFLLVVPTNGFAPWRLMQLCWVVWDTSSRHCRSLDIYHPRTPTHTHAEAACVLACVDDEVACDRGGRCRGTGLPGVVVVGNPVVSGDG